MGGGLDDNPELGSPAVAPEKAKGASSRASLRAILGLRREGRQSSVMKSGQGGERERFAHKAIKTL